jgi:hypothetical protein
MLKKLSYWYYDFKVSRLIPHAPEPSLVKKSNFILLSLLCKRDIYQYMAAVLSFRRYLCPEKIVIVNDGTLTKSDEQSLSYILGELEFRSLDEFRLPGLPVGGCWERIAAVSEYSKGTYVMQMDADTLFMSSPDELIRAINCGQSFCLPTISGVAVCKAWAAIEFAKAKILTGDKFIQFELEAALAVLGDINNINYIRACAGLGGYAPGVVTYEILLDISDRYRAIFKERWDAWGTEQFVSNFILANTKNVAVLPVSRYNSVDMFSNNLAFIHFIGSYRFKSGYYMECSKKVLQAVYSN